MPGLNCVRDSQVTYNPANNVTMCRLNSYAFLIILEESKKKNQMDEFTFMLNVHLIICMDGYLHEFF